MLYPLKDFCVGYNLLFNIEEIDGFILVNRILTNKELIFLKNLISNNNIKGIVFDDVGIIELLKDINVIKILMLNHLANNFVSINYYLDYVDSVIISNDLTKEEILNILRNSQKPLIINVFGLNNLMYSRRQLLRNYNKHFKKDLEKKIDTYIDKKYFTFFENNYGTIIYSEKYYDALELIPNDNVLYYWYNPVFLEKEKILNVVINNNTDGIETYPGFLYQKTIYKLKDGDKK